MLDLLKLSFVINNSGLQSGQIQVKLDLNVLSKESIIFVQDSSSRSSQYLAINSDVALPGPTARKDSAPMHYFVIKYANIQKLKSITYFVHNFPNKTGCREGLPRWMRPSLRTQRELQLPVSILICLVWSQNFYKTCVIETFSSLHKSY